MITFADTLNFHSRNFPALYRAIQYDRIPVRYVRWGDEAFKKAFGYYSANKEELQPYLAELRKRPLHELRSYTHRGAVLWDVCKYEVLQRLMLDRRWHENVRRNDDESLFDEIARTSKEVLLLNLAAAGFWIDFWREDLGPRDATGSRPVGLFGNSLSYTRALSAQSETLGLLPIVFEHFFTGHDHYMEVRKAPIQGFSELRLRVREDAEVDEDLVYRRLAEMRNKNVQQGSWRREPRPRHGKRTVLVLGQVVNDFAAISPANHWLGTIGLYKLILAGLLAETDCDVIVKTHPYEPKKTRERGAITFEELRAFVAGKGNSAQRRVTIVEDYPLESLFAESDLIVTLHSQGALEAIPAGLPVATVGNPFYGGQGFTRDFDHPSELIAAVASDESLFELSPTHQRRYLAFMTQCFRTLVNRNEPRDQMLARLAVLGLHPGTPNVQPGAKDKELKKGSPLSRKARKLFREPRMFFTDAFDNLRKRKS